MDHMEFSIALPPQVDFTSAGFEWADMKQRQNAHCRHSSDIRQQRDGLVKAFLINIATEQVQEIFSMFGLTYEEAVKFSQILQLLEDTCLPRFLIIYNRYKFFTCKQHFNNTFDDFLRDLLNWSENCEFGDLKDILLKDCIITGIPDASIRQKLLETEELDFTKTVEICRAIEKRQKVRNAWISTNPTVLVDASVGTDSVEFIDRQKLINVTEFSHASTNTDFENCAKLVSEGTAENVRGMELATCVKNSISFMKPLDQSENVEDYDNLDASDRAYGISEKADASNHNASVFRDPHRSNWHSQLVYQNSDTKEKQNVDINLNICRTDGELNRTRDSNKQGIHENSFKLKISKICLEINKTDHESAVNKRVEKKPEILSEVTIHQKQERKLAANCKENIVKKREHVCSFCKQSFTSKVLMLAHVSKFHGRKHCRRRNLQCQICKATFLDLTGLTTHRLTHKSEKKFRCDFCPAKFGNPSHLRVHMRLHTGERPYTCDTCGASYPEASKLKAHLRRHTGEKPYQCSVCSRTFAWTAAYTRHVRTHTGEKPYTCEFCGVCFADFTSLQRHIRTHTLEKPYQCNTCSSKFTDPSALKLHNRIHNGERPFACSTCGTTFIRSQHLKEHMKLHTGEKPFRCETCGALFAEASKLKSHSRKHTGEKPYLCKICGTRFAWTAAFTRHMRTHTLEKPYVCDVCGSHYADHSTLTRHIRTHTGERPYPCNVCGTGFADNSSLHRHMRIHTGEKSYTCEVCGSSFAVKSYLARHMRMHTGEKPYHCDLCGSKFTDSSKLNRHKKIHTKDKMKWDKQEKQETHNILPSEQVQPVPKCLPNEAVHQQSTNENLAFCLSDLQSSVVPQQSVLITTTLLPLNNTVAFSSSMFS